ncbi:LptA/OstA family protein [Deltaproteobacteria bacterium TL4]
MIKHAFSDQVLIVSFFGDQRRRCFKSLLVMLFLMFFATTLISAQSSNPPTPEKYKITRNTLAQLQQEAVPFPIIGALQAILNQVFATREAFLLTLQKLPIAPIPAQHRDLILRHALLDKLQIRSKEFSGNLAQGEVIFKGEVVGQMPKEDLHFWASKLRILNGGGDNYEKIFAEGNVKLQQFNQNAEADYVVYSQLEQHLQLEGNVRIKTPRSLVMGTHASIDGVKQFAFIQSPPNPHTEERVKLLFFLSNVSAPRSKSPLIFPILGPVSTSFVPLRFSEEVLEQVHIEHFFPSDVFSKFETLKKQTYSNRHQMTLALEKTIGIERTFRYKTALIKLSEVPPYELTSEVLQRLKEQKTPEDLRLPLEKLSHRVFPSITELSNALQSLEIPQYHKFHALIARLAQKQPGMKLTDLSFTKLTRPQLSNEVITKLRYLLNKKYDSRGQFIETLNNTLGKELTERHQVRLFQEVAGPPYLLNNVHLLRLSEHPLPEAILSKLRVLKDQLFQSEEDLLKSLEYHLGWDGAQLYQTQILSQTEPASYRISEYALARLEQEGLPFPVVSQLEHLQNQDYRTEKEFIQVLKATLGTEVSTLYQTFLLKYCSSFAPQGSLVSIQAQRITLDAARNAAQFEGQVEMERFQEQMYLKAEKIVLYTDAQQTLKSAQAQHAVCLEQPDRIAKAERAVFDEVRQIIQLEGNAEVHTGQYNLKGNTIHLFMDVKEGEAQGDNKSPIMVTYFPTLQPPPFQCR